MSTRLAVIGGDGIGPEVVAEGLKVLDAVLPGVERTDYDLGAQAYLRVELQTGGELLFCAHHAREHGDKLRSIASHVHDETHKLEPTPAGARESD